MTFSMAASARLVDVIHCGSGLDTVVSYDRGPDVLVDCESTEALDSAR